MDNVIEVWKDIPHYEGLYQVSNLGNIYSVRYGKRLKPVIMNNGYCAVTLRNIYGKQKIELIHRLVALSFLPNPNQYPQVNHKDENKANNKVSNLEWCTAKYNYSYGTKPQKMREAALRNGLGKGTPWNKGLTAETDERVRAYGRKESLTKQKRKGEMRNEIYL